MKDAIGTVFIEIKYKVISIIALLIRHAKGLKA